ncbi:MAG: dockerin type I domain-containing protein [Phycisphaerae bacterium]|jgi:hypothetical protein
MTRRVFVMLVLAAGCAGWLAARATSTRHADVDAAREPGYDSSASVAPAPGAVPSAVVSGQSPLPALTQPVRPPTLTAAPVSPAWTRAPTEFAEALVERTASVSKARPGVVKLDVQSSARAVQPRPESQFVVEMSFDSTRSTITLQFALKPADIDRNGAVNTEDLRELITAIEQGNSTADVNGDGIVDGRDIADLLAQIGEEDRTEPG